MSKTTLQYRTNNFHQQLDKTDKGKELKQTNNVDLHEETQPRLMIR